ncbi:M23 family metallopeptidase [Corynebacterium sp. ES2794-CONJ1]|nr:M23 family metallopeptidase [Corynebacterium sp. ES2794-CONJ1]MCS4490905.1 M23 family metallopeptidase [Corynebacterium sp. ES2715-CONJ3]MCS4531213.1 M23 family metallopeptidase [Corynebacterium sp. ES2730-CONJ]MCU9518581.1 M23 family metallopeptidase [Corynebacterium sp. ES2794-CONJ1]
MLTNIKLIVIISAGLSVLSIDGVVAATPNELYSSSQAAFIDPITGTSTVSFVIHGFDDLEHNWHAGHRGVDLRASRGAPVVAAGEGEVYFSGSVAGVPSISIQHPNGVRTTYTPVDSTLSNGDPVYKGQVLGTLGNSGRDHDGLHWGAKIASDRYIDPLSLLADIDIRLKPWNHMKI